MGNLTQIETLIETEHKREAGTLLAQVLQSDPTDADAWLLFSRCVEAKEQQIDCLKRVLRYRPEDAEAQAELARLTGALPSAAPMWPVLVNSSEPVQQEKPDVHDEVKPASFVKPVIPPTLRFETEQTSRPVQEKPLEKPKVSLKPMVKSNPAGESTQKMAIWYAGKNEVQRIYVFVFWGAMAVSIVLMLIYPSSILGLFVFALAMYGIIDFLLKKEKRSRKLTKNFAKGAKGEMVVGQILAELGDEFAVWHDVPGRYGNFDHVVLSKSGQLFAIETKAHSGKVRIVGERILVNNYEPEKNMIGQCTSNWVSLRETVQMVTGKTVYVTPLLVFTNAFVVPGKPVKGIYIVNKKYLKQTILNNCRNKVDRFHLWDDLTILNKIFSQKNLTYKEFSRNDFESISSWGKQSF